MHAQSALRSRDILHSFLRLADMLFRLLAHLAETSIFLELGYVILVFSHTQSVQLKLTPSWKFISFRLDWALELGFYWMVAPGDSNSPSTKYISNRCYIQSLASERQTASSEIKRASSEIKRTRPNYTISESLFSAVEGSTFAGQF